MPTVICGDHLPPSSKSSPPSRRLDTASSSICW